MTPLLATAAAAVLLRPAAVLLRPAAPSSRAALPPLLAAASSLELPAATAAASGSEISTAWEAWPRTWVPLASTFELDPERPTPVRFLGRNLVLWQDNGGVWRAFADACPHRLAPLSEGRIDRARGTLECAYHGWQFEAQGACSRIPQVEPEVERAACSSKRSCVQAFPVQIEKSVLFVWPWGGEPADGSGPLGESALPRHQLSSVKDGASTFTRDLPYGWDTLLENIVDPSHVPFAHHGLQGRREDAVPINMSLQIPVGPSGFDFEWADRTMGMRRAGNGSFAPRLASSAATAW